MMTLHVTLPSTTVFAEQNILNKRRFCLETTLILFLLLLLFVDSLSDNEMLKSLFSILYLSKRSSNAFKSVLFALY